MVKNPPANARDARDAGVKVPWTRKWQPTPVFLPGKFHGQRILADYTVHAMAKSQTLLSNLHFHREVRTNKHV